MSTRVMAGLMSMEGREINGLRVGQMLSRRPQPHYEVTCNHCGARSSASQIQLTSGAARCRAGDCGKPARGRDGQPDLRKQLAAREAERIAQELEVSERRMAAETDGWERPTKYRPDPSPYQPMSERERLALRERRAEAEAAERAERERIEAPIQAAKVQLDETYRKLVAVQRDRLLGRTKDPDPVPSDPQLNGVRMSRAAADKFNVREFTKFQEQHPEIFWTHELLEQMGAYWDANRLQIISATMLDALVSRYRDAGLLPDPPAPEPEPEPIPEPEPSEPSGPTVYTGIDPETGVERTYTEFEVNKMPSETFRKTFRVAGTIAECFTAMQRQRVES